MESESNGTEEFRTEIALYRFDRKSGCADVGLGYDKIHADMQMLYVRTVKWLIGTTLAGTVIGLGGFTALFWFIGR